MRFYLAMLPLLLLTGCSDEQASGLEESSAIITANELNASAYQVVGTRNIKLYSDKEMLSSNRLPITLTNGKDFLVKLPAELSGETVFVEIDGFAKEVVISAKEGETQFVR